MKSGGRGVVHFRLDMKGGGEGVVHFKLHMKSGGGGGGFTSGPI